jgi:hypothetical protein
MKSHEANRPQNPEVMTEEADTVAADNVIELPEASLPDKISEAADEPDPITEAAVSADNSDNENEEEAQDDEDD